MYRWRGPIRGGQRAWSGRERREERALRVVDHGKRARRYVGGAHAHPAPQLTHPLATVVDIRDVDIGHPVRRVPVAFVERDDRALYLLPDGEAHDRRSHDLHFRHRPAEERAVKVDRGGDVGAHEVATDKAARCSSHDFSEVKGSGSLALGELPWRSRGIDSMGADFASLTALAGPRASARGASMAARPRGTGCM